MQDAVWRNTSRTLIAVVLSALLAAAPAVSATQRNLGFISWAENAQLDGLVAASGANVFSGDLLTTSSNGSLRVQVSSSQLLLPGGSVIRISEQDGSSRATLTSGTVMLTAGAAAKISVSALDILIRPQTSAPTTARITIKAPDELRIAAQSGSLELELDGESYTLTPGHSWGVRVVPAARENTDRRSARSRRGLLIFLIGTAGIAGITYLIRELRESPDVP